MPSKAGAALRGLSQALGGVSNIIGQQRQLKAREQQQAQTAEVLKQRQSDLADKRSFDFLKFANGLESSGARKKAFLSPKGQQATQRIFGQPINQESVDLFAGQDGKNLFAQVFPVVDEAVQAGNTDVIKQVQQRLQGTNADPEAVFTAINDSIKLTRQIQGAASFQSNQQFREKNFNRQQEGLEIQRERLAQTRDENQFKFEERVINSFNKDKDVIKANESISAADRVLALNNLSVENPIAAQALPTFIARASGEVGNLSEGDKRPFGGSQAIRDRLAQAQQSFLRGTLTAENREFIRQIAELMKNTSNDIKNRRADKIANQFGQVRSEVDKDRVFTLLGVNQPRQTTQQQEQPPNTPQSPTPVTNQGEQTIDFTEGLNF